MHVRNRNDGEKEQCCGLEIKAYPSHITPATLVSEWLCDFVGRKDFELFFRFENTASCIQMLDDTLIRANCACLLALSCSDRVLCCGDCAVLSCAMYSTWNHVLDIF